MRNNTADVLRLFAAIGVIGLHVGSFTELPPVGGEIIRALLRCCVPIFFLLTGFFLADAESGYPKTEIKRPAHAAAILLVSSIVFLPIYASSEIADKFSLSVFLSGTSFHLWYLSALAIAYIALQMLKQSKVPAGTAMILCGIYLLVYVAINYLVVVTDKGDSALIFLRELLGIPFLLLGAFLASHRQSVSPIALIAGGIFVTAVEAVAFLGFGLSTSDAQFFIGTTLLAAGLVMYFIRMKREFPAKMAEIGRDDSLLIYLYHPLAIIVINSAMSGRLNRDISGVNSLLLWSAVTISVVAGVKLLSYFPRIKRILAADFAR